MKRPPAGTSKMQMLSQSLHDRKQQSQKSVDGWDKRSEQLRITIEESQGEMEHDGQKSKRHGWSKQIWTWISEACRRKSEEEVVLLPNQMGAVFDSATVRQVVTMAGSTSMAAAFSSSRRAQEKI